jgi:metal-sulfur cluster biosynthetic enzyme
MAMPTEREVERALRDVNDPEYPISIVDMGLVRGIAIDGGRARVRIAYTSLGCPCKDLIVEDVRTRLLEVEGVVEVEVEEVFDEWSRDQISRRGIRTLRGLGVG